MLDIFAAALITLWVLHLLWQLVRGAVPARTLSRLSGNSRLIAGYHRSARVVAAGSIGLAFIAGFAVILFIEGSSGVTVWIVWSLAALVVGGFLFSRRLAQIAVAADKGSSSGRVQDK